MSSYLQAQLKYRMHEKGLTVTELEKRAGVKGAVTNVLHGKTRVPRADILLAIADALECTAKDLLDPQTFVSKGSEVITPVNKKPLNKVALNLSLLKETIDEVHSCYEQLKSQPDFDQFLLAVKDVYIYSSGKSGNKVDPKFSEWIVEQRST